jgi:hypothetical protein
MPYRLAGRLGLGYPRQTQSPICQGQLPACLAGEQMPTVGAGFV